jgi:energy-coupling factor transporter transmembrane protein EcfT
MNPFPGELHSPMRRRRTRVELDRRTLWAVLAAFCILFVVSAGLGTVSLVGALWVAAFVGGLVFARKQEMRPVAKLIFLGLILVLLLGGLVLVG